MIRVGELQKGKAAESIQHVISKIEYYDTPYGVPTLGMNIGWAPLDRSSPPTTTGSYEAIGNDRIISHNFGDGSAFGMPGVDYFRVYWSGYFYAQTGGDYDFIINKDETSRGTLVLDGNTRVATTGVESTKVEAITLTSGWHEFGYTYDEYEKESYTSLLFRPPGSDYYRPVSAGVTNTTSGFMEPSLLQGYLKVEGGYGHNQSRAYTITVPLSPSPDSTTFVSGNDVSYYFDAGKGVYVMRSLVTRDDGSKYYSESDIKQGRMVVLYAGYQSKCSFASGSCTNTDANVTGFYASVCENYGNPTCPANTVPSTDYIQRFEGIIIDFNVKIGKEEDLLEIVCQDSMTLLQEAFDKNYPDHLSYLNTALHVDPPLDESTGNSKARFITSVFENPSKRPKAYDSWPAGFAIRDILFKTHIDPSKLFGKTGAPVNKPWIQQNLIAEELDKINLSRNPNFGSSYVPGAIDNEDDDKYIWTWNFGDKLDEAVKRIVDTYGYRFGITTNGYVKAEKVIAESVGTTSAETQFDGEAIGGQTFQASAEGTESTVTGSRIVVKTVVTTGTGPQYDSFRITKNAGPNVKPSNWSQTYPHNVLIGAYWGPSTATGENWDTINYTNSLFAFKPTSDMSVSGIRMSIMADYTRGGYPITGGARVDYCQGMAAKVYFGVADFTAGSGLRITGSKTLVATNVRPDDFGPVDLQSKNFTFDFDFNSAFSVSSGVTYAVEFATTGGGSEQIPTGFGVGRYVLLNSFVSSGTSDTNPYNTLYVTGYSNAAFSGISDTGTYAGTQRVYADIEFRSAYPAVSLGNTGHKRTYVEVKDTGGNLILKKYVTQTTDETRHYSQGVDKWNDYVSEIVVEPWELTSGIAASGGSFDSLDEYVVKVGSTDPSTDLQIEQITAQYDSSAPVWTFDTFENIIGELGLVSNHQNVRNDVTVIGNQRSIETDTINKQVINRNNPTYIYTVSRAIDLNSIYGINTPQSIGRRKDFMIFEPGIKSQGHADWLASGLLMKYRHNKNGTSFESTAVPFIEPKDVVYVSDASAKTPTNNSTTYKQYVESVKETIEKDRYTMSFETTPYADWPSFDRTNLPSVSVDSDAFVNIGIFGSDGVLVQTGSDAISTGTFNVYESEDLGAARRLIEINFKQQMEGFTTVRVIDSQTEKPVAYLIGSIEDGEKTPEYIEAGTDMRVFWDGMDEFGHTKLRGQIENSPLITGFVVAPESPGYYSFPGRYYVEFEVQDPIDETNVRTVRSNFLEKSKNSKYLSGLLNSYAGNYYRNYIDIEWSEMGDGRLVIKDSTETSEDYTTHNLSDRARKDIANSEKLTTTDGTDRNVGYDQIPRTWYLDFEETENGSDGLKFKVVFDTTVENPNRIYSVEAKLKHFISSCIFVRRPDRVNSVGDTSLVGRFTQNDLYRDIPGQGCLYISKDYANRDAAFEHFKNHMRDSYAIDNSLVCWKAFDIIDRFGTRMVSTASAGKVRADEHSEDDKYIDTEGLPDTLIGNTIMDKNMMEHRENVYNNQSDLEGPHTENWGSKMIFATTPTEVIEDDEFFSLRKIRVSEEQPWLELSYNPKLQKYGAIDFYRVPKFANQSQLDRFKQNLREAFNIAKWHNGIDKFGYPEFLNSSNDNTDLCSVWRQYLGRNAVDGSSKPAAWNGYWRNDTDIANYIKIGVLHIIQVEVSVWDNTGRGMSGNLQPSRQIRAVVRSDDSLTQRNEANRQDWSQVVGGTHVNGLTNEGPLGFGYDRFQDYNRFMFHIYWKPGTSAKQELSRFGVASYTPEDDRFWPANVMNHADGKHWATPIMATFSKDGESNQENSIYFYHECMGASSANEHGASRGDRKYSPISVYGSMRNLCTPPEVVNSKYLNHPWGVKTGTSTLVQAYVGGNIGPKWHMFSLPNGFGFSDIEGLRQIPIRGVVRENG